jgi:Domain of unknown function (DUF4396)
LPVTVGAVTMPASLAVLGALGGTTADAIWATWIVLAVASAGYVAYDAFTQNPELTVMKWGWVLVTLYIGPIGAALYVLSCKEPSPGTHEAFVAPLWKQSLGSTIHCLAGDATGIIVASVVTTAAGLPMWGDTIVEYVFGFAFGLLIFQALFMRDMLGGSYRRAVSSTVVAEWLSMNCVMAGMIPVMVILRTDFAGTTHIGSVRFWIVLSLAVLVGLVVAYPVNVWLVSEHLKHGMGTVRALGEGGEPLPVPAAAAGNMDMDMADSTVTRAQIVAVAALTLTALGAGILLAAAFGDFSM